MQWGGHNYFLSWREPWHKFEDWDWFNGRNFCRDRCMDLVSFDTAQENDLFSAIIRQGQKVVPASHTTTYFFQKLIKVYIQDQNPGKKATSDAALYGVVKLNVCTLLLT